MNELNNRVAEIKLNVPSQHNPLLAKVLDIVNNDEEIKTLWVVINTNATERLRMSDHGNVHFQIVSNIALKIARTLKKHGVKLSIEENFGLSYDHGELVIFLASVMHDLGMSINRDGHEEFSLFKADRILSRILDFLPTIERTIVISETLHAIISHRSDGSPITIEGGIVRVADCLDMGEGRSRISYQAGEKNIYAISDAAISGVEIKDGETKPLLMSIKMNNSAGIFQIDELLKKKLKGSGLEKYVSVRAYIEGGQEKNLLQEFSID